MSMSRRTVNSVYAAALAAITAAALGIAAWVAPVAAQSGEPAAGDPAAKGPPKARVDGGAIHDFGFIWAGPKLEHAFRIVNDGETDLEIIEVKPTCGCTTAGDYPRRIAPGASGSIPFRLDSNKVHNKFSKAIYITTNDPASPTVELKLAGDCRRVVEVTPPNAGFGRLLKQEPIERVLTMKNTRDEPMKPQIVQQRVSSRYKAHIEEVAAGKEYRLLVRLEPPYSPGAIAETIKIDPGLKGVEPISVAAYAMVPQRVEAFPSIILLPTSTVLARATGPTTRQVQLLNHGDKPVKLLGATTNDQSVKLTTRETTAGKAYEVRVEVPPAYQPLPEGSFVSIKTDDSDKQEFVVPIRLTGQSGGDSAANPGATKQTAGAKTEDPSKPKERPVMTMLNQPSPEYELETLEGAPLAPRLYRHHPATVLNFIAPNCGFCKKQLPVVERIRERYASRGVRFVNVMQTMRTPFTVPQIVEVLNAAGSNLEVSIDPGNSVGRRFKVSSFPSLFVLDSAGTIREVVPGAKQDLDEVLTKRLDGLLSPAAAERPSEPAKSTASQPAAAGA